MAFKFRLLLVERLSIGETNMIEHEFAIKLRQERCLDRSTGTVAELFAVDGSIIRKYCCRWTLTETKRQQCILYRFLS
ncbi:hypothetical protein AB6A40_008725 [Gnathostoma spinigerum]|uniref:Uncharacterized protein n=1 Tax=Gnathostoma spinigerum TaxID=75299 RepID=A0ABD6EWZ7_9BILA